MSESNPQEQIGYNPPLSSNLKNVFDKGIASVIEKTAPLITADEKNQLTRDISDIIAPHINKHTYLINKPGMAADLIISKLFEPKEGEEDPNTKEGRTAKKLRELGEIKLGGFYTESLTKLGIRYYLKDELIARKEEAQQAMAKDNELIILGSNLNQVAENSAITQLPLSSQQIRTITLGP
jgi:hypothetical protein